jgi:hypothetical protein
MDAEGFPWAIAIQGIYMIIPSKKELGVLALLAVCCTLIVGLLPQRDVALMCCGGPLTLVAALIGYRRNQVRLAMLAAQKEEEIVNGEL